MSVVLVTSAVCYSVVLNSYMLYVLNDESQLNHSHIDIDRGGWVAHDGVGEHI